MPATPNKMNDSDNEPSFFDNYSDQYAEQLHKGLSATGEDVLYFARGRVKWLAARLARYRYRISSVLDFGCGVGNSAPLFVELLKAERVVGLDPSPASIEVARQRHGSQQVSFVLPNALDGEAFDLAFCNGVFHHIDPKSRPEALQLIRNSLRPGALFAFWENNPWNPGTRYVMSRVEFDRDAITITPPEARHLLVASGFELLTTDYLFIFPKSLRRLRPLLEPLLSALPLGGQYMVLCRKGLKDQQCVFHHSMDNE